jgi:hypothetical protein
VLASLRFLFAAAETRLVRCVAARAGEARAVFGMMVRGDFGMAGDGVYLIGTGRRRA